MKTDHVYGYIFNRKVCAKVGRKGGLARGRKTLVYLDGVPMTIEQLAEHAGMNARTVEERVRAMRKLGIPVTLESLKVSRRSLRA